MERVHSHQDHPRNFPPHLPSTVHIAHGLNPLRNVTDSPIPLGCQRHALYPLCERDQRRLPGRQANPFNPRLPTRLATVYPVYDPQDGLRYRP